MANPKPVIYSDFTDSPQFLKEFLYYNQTIKGLSARTVEAYYLDLNLFLRYISQKRQGSVDNDTIEDVKISDFAIDWKCVFVFFVFIYGCLFYYGFGCYWNRSRNHLLYI